MAKRMGLDWREYIDLRITELSALTDAKFVTFRTLVDSQAEKVALALEASDKAISKSDTATEKRFENVNEFRAQLADQARTLMPRQESEQRMQSVVDRFETAGIGTQRERDSMAERILLLEKAVAISAAGERGQLATWAKIGAVVAGIAALATIVATVIIIGTR